jgi:hypothetical protein
LGEWRGQTEAFVAGRLDDAAKNLFLGGTLRKQEKDEIVLDGAIHFKFSAGKLVDIR